MRRTYSGFVSREQRSNSRKTIGLLVLSFAILALLLTYGIGAVGKISAFLSNLRGSKTITTNDTTPPAPPTFNFTNDFVKDPSFNLTGRSETGATVKLTFDGQEVDTVTDKDGNFLFDLKLNDGANSFSAVSVDTSGNVSQKTKDYQITLDQKAPDLTIDSPQDGSQYFGSTQRQISIRGTTEENANVAINGRVIAVDSDGKFQYTLTLSPGENQFNIKVTDQAGNLTEKNLTLNYSE